MSLFRSGSAVAVAAIFSVASLVPLAQAANPAVCVSYANQAVFQQHRNLKMGCGFVGPRWQKNYGAHFAWCLTAPYGAVTNETAIRHNMLNQCSGGPLPFTKTFVKPMYNGYRLDWCYSWATQCGAFAAKAFCVANGYPHVHSFGKASHIGTFTKTRVFATNQVCSGPNCDGFTFIKCQK